MCAFRIKGPLAAAAAAPTSELAASRMASLYASTVAFGGGGGCISGLTLNTLAVCLMYSSIIAAFLDSDCFVTLLLASAKALTCLSRSSAEKFVGMVPWAALAVIKDENASGAVARNFGSCGTTGFALMRPTGLGNLAGTNLGSMNPDLSLPGAVLGAPPPRLLLAADAVLGAPPPPSCAAAREASNAALNPIMGGTGGLPLFCGPETNALY